MPEPSRTSPELAAAAKRITALEADIANLRRGMVAQLTASGRLLQALQEADGKLFMGRYAEEAAAAEASPVRDLEAGEAVVAAMVRQLESAPAARLDDRVAAEVAAREAELGQLRAQIIACQEDRQRRCSDLEGRLAAAHDALQRECELRRADLAEARSMAAEIERIAGADPEAASAPALATALASLHEAVEAGAAEGMGAAAEEVLVGWTRVANQRAAAAAQELSALRWQLGDLEHRQRSQGESQRLKAAADGERTAALEAEAADRRQALAALEADRDRLRGELAAAADERDLRREEAARLADALARVNGETDSARRRISELDAGAVQVRERLDAAEARVGELAPEVERLRAVVAESAGRANARERELAALRREHGDLRQRLAAAEAATAAAQAAEAGRAAALLAAERERDAARQQLAVLDEERRRLAERQEQDAEAARQAGRRQTAQRDEAERRLREREQELGEMRLGLESAQADVQRLRGELERLSTARQQGEEAAAEAIRRAAAVMRDLEDARARAEGLEAEAAEARRLAAQGAAEAADLRTAVAELRARGADLERAAASAGQELRLAAEARAGHDAMRRGWVAQRAEMEELLRAARAAVAAARESLQRMASDNRQVVEALQAELVQARHRTAGAGPG